MTTFPEFRDPLLDVSGNTAAFYEREFYVFSNFASFQVEWRELLYPTSEHAYQSAKFAETVPELATQIRLARSAHLAWELGRANKDKSPENWDEIKEDVMLDICRHKLQQHEYIQKKLAQTGTALIVEDSDVDSFWGWGPDRKGQNALGKVWMKLRDEMNAGDTEP